MNLPKIYVYKLSIEAVEALASHLNNPIILEELSFKKTHNFVNGCLKNFQVIFSQSIAL